MVKLRPLEEKDAVLMLEWMHDEDVTRYLRLNVKDSTLDDAIRFINNAKDEKVNLHRAIVDYRDCYLGTVSLKNIDCTKMEAEYAIVMHPSSIGIGAASAASRMIIKLAFEELKLVRVYLNVLKNNQRAIKLYEKIGFCYTHSNNIIFRGENAELVWYEIKNRL